MADLPVIAVFGAAGRMGQEVIRIIQADQVALLGVAIEREGHASLGQPVLGCDVDYTDATAVQDDNLSVTIAFTTPEAISASVTFARQHGIALVLGTTGASTADEQSFDELAKEVPVLVGANMSLGVNVLFHLVRQAAQQLPHWDAEIFDLHHRAKLDAPSGTAARLGEILQDARTNNDRICTDRTTRRIPRPSNEIGMAIMRAGDVVGEHIVLLAGTGERLELTHRSMSRSNFAAGAVHAAKFLQGKPAGRYSMDDVLGLNLVNPRALI